ncbi:MAG: hydroxylamine reductase, partial [Halanaerobiales bacterium]
MSMFCFQCQETAQNVGCRLRGVCGKTEDVANLQDLLIDILKGISIYSMKAKELDIEEDVESKYNVDRFILEGLFATITNGNFDSKRFENLIKKALDIREDIRINFEKVYQDKFGDGFGEELPEEATWYSNDIKEFYEKGTEVGVLTTEDVDIRSLRELIIYGIKGIAAYAD